MRIPLNNTYCILSVLSLSLLLFSFVILPTLLLFQQKCPVTTYKCFVLFCFINIIISHNCVNYTRELHLIKEILCQPKVTELSQQSDIE